MTPNMKKVYKNKGLFLSEHLVQFLSRAAFFCGGESVVEFEVVLAVGGVFVKAGCSLTELNNCSLTCFVSPVSLAVQIQHKIFRKRFVKVCFFQIPA